MPLHIPRVPRTGSESRLDQSAPQMCYQPGYLDPSGAGSLFEQLRAELDWRRESVVMFGRRQRVPRQVWWCGDCGFDYRYAGVAHACDGWYAPLEELRAQLTRHLDVSFNFVLLNRYRSGEDHMGWHADDETALGAQPIIASISLGATRRFRIRERRAPATSAGLDLEHGSLLLAWGDSQRHYQHCITRTRRPVGERINLTFRQLLH